MREKLELFMGPCVLESRLLALDIAGSLVEQLDKFKDRVSLTFKGSYDKANRSSIDSYRGPGLQEGLKILEEVKKNVSLPTVTDFHHPSEAQEVAQVVDVLQVPAFLCRQTDMICEGARACRQHGRRLKIKKGQFLSPEEVGNIVDKASSLLLKEAILVTERGTSFGYNNLVVDMASFQIIKSFGVKAVHDATHCVQRPGGLGKSSGGKREQVEVLARAALAAGAQAIFMEVHPNPDRAKSDGATAIPLERVGGLVADFLRFYEAAHGEIVPSRPSGP